MIWFIKAKGYFMSWLWTKYHRLYLHKGKDPRTYWLTCQHSNPFYRWYMDWDKARRQMKKDGRL